MSAWIEPLRVLSLLCVSWYVLRRVRAVERHMQQESRVKHLRGEP